MGQKRVCWQLLTGRVLLGHSKAVADHDTMSYPTVSDVFEHGILVVDGNPPPPAGLSCLATTREPIYSGYTLALVDGGGSSLNHATVRVTMLTCIYPACEHLPCGRLSGEYSPYFRCWMRCCSG